MSKIPLPPPPGFERIKKEFGNSKRYVYPFTESESGYKAQLLHEWFLAEQDELWKKSALRRLIIHHGWSAIRALQHNPQSIKKTEAAKLGITLASMQYPLFMRRNPLDQVYEHMRHQPRYFMKIDIADAFGCVYPGFHEKFPLPSLGESRDLFEWLDHGQEKHWNGWPFFHPGDGGLIQGAPASPLLFEKACALSGLDKILRDTAVANNATVTRYVDDIVFSRLPFDDRPFGKSILPTLKKKIQTCGFAVNLDKCRQVDTRYKPIEFLGVRVLRNRIKVRPAFFHRIAELGYLGEGHCDWIDQVERLREDLQIVRKRNKRAGGR